MDLTLNAVKYAALQLIECYGNTTTLEVKMHLRQLGYTAVQTQVSELMAQAGMDLPLDSTSNGNHLIFTLPKIDDVIDDNQHSDDSTSSSSNTQNTNRGRYEYIKRDGTVVAGFESIDDAERDAGAGGAIWHASSVHDSGDYLFFSAISYTREDARTAFGKIRGVDYNDVRAHR